MKRKGIVKTLALAMAITLAAAPMSAITAHAGNNGINDGCVGVSGPGMNGDGRHPRPGVDDDDAVTEDLGRQEGATFNAGSDAGGSSDSGNGDNGDYGGSSDSYNGSADNSGGSYAGGNESTGSGNGPVSAPTGLALKGSTVSVPGYETWRQVADAVVGTFSVYHCGIEQYTLQIKNADGKAVSYKGAALAQTEDGKWYINITTADTDTTGWTVSTKKGTADYLPKLGISGVMLNDAIAVDAAN